MLKFRAFKTAFDHAWFAPDPLDRVAQFVAQMREAEAAHMAQLDAFELRPQPLTGIQGPAHRPGGARHGAVAWPHSRGTL